VIVALSQSPTLPVSVRRSAQQRGPFAEMARHWADYLYVLPALLVMLLVIGYPIIYTIYLSFFNTNPSAPTWSFTGLDNYKAILTDGDIEFWAITWNTIVWTVSSTILAFIIGLGAAMVVQREFIGRGFVRALLLIPYVISAVPAAYIWRWLLHSDFGLISGMLMQWGLIDKPIVFLDSTTFALPSLIVVNVWKEFPFAMIMMLAGLQTVPEGLLRAARVDGAGAVQAFFHVTVPHLKSVILITTILLFVGNLNSFTLPWIMTGGGPANATMIWILKVYTLAFQDLQYGLASAFSVILFIVMVAFGYYYVKALTGGGNRREAE
jgi:multiple sugar transport system permease protein